MATERFANDVQTTLASSVDSSQGTINVASAAGFPTQPQFRLRIGNEFLLVTGVSGTAWTVSRGAEGSSGAPHTAGVDVVHVVTAGALGVTSDPAAATPGLRSLGTGATQAASGADSRLSDQRTPSQHHTTHEPGGTDPMAVDAAAGTGSLRTLGSTANQAASGSHTHTESQVANLTTDLAAKESLANKDVDGTLAANSDTKYASQKATKTYVDAQTAAGAPNASDATKGITKLSTAPVSGVNPIAVGDNDPRNTNSRAPTGHHASHEPGGSDAMVVDAAAGVGSLRTLGAGATQAVAGNDSRLAAGGVPASILEMYVDYVNGNDSNNGLSWSGAKKTIQAAYTALSVYAQANYAGDTRIGVGRIHLTPGDHDVGAGLALETKYLVELIGTRSGRVNHGVTASASRIVTSSATATEMVKITPTASPSQLGQGFVFRDLAFSMNATTNPALTKIIWINQTGHAIVERCSFINTAGGDADNNVSVTAIYHQDATGSGGEAGWVRILENNCSRMQLYQATTGSTGGNFNRGIVRDNVVMFGHDTMAMLQFNADHNGLLCSGNNLEGWATGIELGPRGAWTQNTFLNNSGEDSGKASTTLVNPFYKIGSAGGSAISQQIIIGGVCTTGVKTNGVWVRFGSNSYRNLVIGVLDLAPAGNANKRVISYPDGVPVDGNYLIPTNVALPTYAATNVTTDRTYDANATTLDEVADVLGTLIADLRARGLVK